MKRICPNPMPWHEAFERLNIYAQSHHCAPPLPPKPLILGGWAYSNDIEKRQRWEETVAWAARNGCAELLSGIPDHDFYFVEEPTSYTVGPFGGPMYRAWDFERKTRPPSKQIAAYMNSLQSRWSEIVGEELAGITRPLAFTGGKARRLLVLAHGAVSPPGAGGRVSPRKNQSDEASLVFVQQSTKLSLLTKLTTSTSQSKQTPKKVPNGARRNRYVPELQRPAEYFEDSMLSIHRSRLSCHLEESLDADKKPSC